MLDRRQCAALLSLCLLALARPAFASERLPAFAKDSPYPTVRARLIEIGIEPVPVMPKPPLRAPCPYDSLFCRTYREVLACGTGGWMQYCQFLFRRRSDGQLLIVQTKGEEDYTVVPADLRGIVVLGISKATPELLADVVIASDARRDRRRGP
jgi:hypothetical protein